jgi:two-component sensor histidine kinase
MIGRSPARFMEKCRQRGYSSAGRSCFPGKSVARADGEDAAGLAEVRHKVANLFQLLSTLTRLRMQRAQVAESRRDLNWLLDNLSALAVVHHRLLSPGGDDFARCLADMADLWRRRCAGRRTTIELVSEPLRVHESHASALALIANELVTNALTHGFPNDRAGAVRVTLERVGEGRAALSVSDDGVGYDPAAIDGSRLGLWLVNGLAAQIRGALTTEAAGGVRCRLEFAA